MNIKVFIEPHERHEAMEAYRQWLSPEQEDEIDEAPDSAIIVLDRSSGKTVVQVIEANQCADTQSAPLIARETVSPSEPD